jgi:mannosyltransferase
MLKESQPYDLSLTVNNQSETKLTKWFLLALILIAFDLRVYHLQSQSLWSDEGLSLYRSRLTIAQNLSNIIVIPPNVPTQDTNPPLYFILLSGLRAFAGESEYALRFLSVIAGVLLVVLLYVTARRLFSTQAGLFAALIGTVSPFMVWYSQEARMYASTAVLTLASVYLLLRAIDFPVKADHLHARSKLIWTSWIVVTLSALATHFLAFFILPFEGLVLLIALGRSRKREILIVSIVLAALSIPLILYGLSRAQRMLDPVFAFRPLDSIAQETWSSFLVGSTSDIFQPWWAVAPGLLMMLVGMIGGLIIKLRRTSTVLTLAYLFIPLLVFYAATFVMPLYIGPRHIIFTLPPTYLLLAVGLALIWQRVKIVGALSLLVVIGLMGWWLNVQFTDPAYLKDDIRSAACTIARKAQADDVVVLNDAISSVMFEYYYARCGGVAPRQIIPTYPSLDYNKALQQFQTAANNANRIWYLTDPSRAGGFDVRGLDEWARGHLLRLGHQRFPSMWLVSDYQLYTAHFPIYADLPDTASIRNVEWTSDTLQLAGAGPINVAAARDVISTTLYWRIDQPLPNNLVITQRLVDDTGAEWGLLIGTAFDNWSAKQWPTGQFIEQASQIDLPHGLPAGRYHLRVSVAEKSGVQLILPGGSIETEAAQVEVQP